ncbi:SpoIIE family protein phosphatase [Sessilibacter corallicola]|uniref:SpoIIE family protein phosphatase n=1 Tax=Sessilibacter corallicola TaxID=2904075 RepID=UPI001E2F4847|nr:SpoIIE family protein phosphatase [Sessilibacter corallicola]MCE2027248.1 SpoIIE family protein phosphatase [Sessilibacter corallicola]
MPIALVDGNKVSRENLRNVLIKEETNVSVEAFDSAKACIHFLNQENSWPTLILITNNIPDSSCVALAEQIRQQAGDRFILINFILDDNNPKLIQQCLEIGDDVIYTPIEQEHFRSKLLAQKRLEQRFLKTEAEKQNLEIYRQNVTLEQDIIERIYDTHCRGNQVDRDNIRLHNSPKALLSGDILITQEGPTGSVYVAIGSVSGRGLPAALGAMPIFSTFRAMTKKGKPVGKIAAEMNRSLATVLPSNMNMSLSLLELSHHCDRLTVWSGGMPYGIIVSSPDAAFEPILSKHPPLTELSEFDFSQDVSVFDLTPGQRIFFHTNSVERSQDGNQQAFGQSDITDCIKSDPSRAFSHITTELEARSQNLDSVFVELLCDVSDAESASNQAANNVAAMPWCLTINLDADDLKSVSPTPQIIRLLSNAVGLDVHQDFLSTVISELYNNALDHGVLGLDSELKATDDGFMVYYSEREKRLKNLKEGSVNISIQYENKEIKISLKDSGKGFNVKQIKKSSELDTFGRGLDIIRSLCSRLEHSEGGTRVTVWYNVCS